MAASWYGRCLTDRSKWAAVGIGGLDGQKERKGGEGRGMVTGGRRLAGGGSQTNGGGTACLPCPALPTRGGVRRCEARATSPFSFHPLTSYLVNFPGRSL